MKKVFLIALALFVGFGVMAYSPPESVEKNSIAVYQVSDQDVMQVVSVDVAMDIEQSEFVFELQKSAIEKIEVGYIEVMPVEAYHRRWQPGNHNFNTAFKIHSKGSSVDKVGYRSAQIDRRFSDKRSC
jgi:hypothetical protein